MFRMSLTLSGSGLNPSSVYYLFPKNETTLCLLLNTRPFRSVCFIRLMRFLSWSSSSSPKTTIAWAMDTTPLRPSICWSILLWTMFWDTISTKGRRSQQYQSKCCPERCWLLWFLVYGQITRHRIEFAEYPGMWIPWLSETVGWAIPL